MRTVIYPVPDLDAAKAWWTEYLGFEPYFDEPIYVGCNVAGEELPTSNGGFTLSHWPQLTLTRRGTRAAMQEKYRRLLPAMPHVNDCFANINVLSHEILKHTPVFTQRTTEGVPIRGSLYERRAGQRGVCKEVSHETRPVKCPVNAGG